MLFPLEKNRVSKYLFLQDGGPPVGWSYKARARVFGLTFISCTDGRPSRCRESRVSLSAIFALYVALEADAGRTPWMEDAIWWRLISPAPTVSLRDLLQIRKHGKTTYSL